MPDRPSSPPDTSPATGLTDTLPTSDPGARPLGVTWSTRLGLPWAAAGPVSPLPQLPQTVRQYEIRTRLGGGGMGVVFHGVRHCDGLEVAVKFVRPDRRHEWSAAGDSLRRFQADGDIPACLSHRNIVRIHEVFTPPGAGADEEPFIAMEFVAGGSLDKHAVRFRAARAAAALMVGVARAVGYLHEQEILHRDLKPHNILLRPTDPPEPVVCDFGLARRLNVPSHTPCGAFLGTPAYASPEQLDGQTLDPRADVFALGVILYELLAGKHPFLPGPQETFGAYRDRRSSLIPAPLDGLVPDDLASICGVCLRPDKEERYETAAQFAADLTSYLDANPES